MCIVNLLNKKAISIALIGFTIDSKVDMEQEHGKILALYLNELSV